MVVPVTVQTCFNAEILVLAFTNITNVMDSNNVQMGRMNRTAL
ncbi:unnamed protein product, partial [Allacma fusca]